MSSCALDETYNVSFHLTCEYELMNIIFMFTNHKVSLNTLGMSAYKKPNIVLWNMRRINALRYLVVKHEICRIHGLSYGVRVGISLMLPLDSSKIVK